VSTPGSAGGATELFVNGTLMRGLGLHANLEGARFLGEHATEPIYRLFSIDDLHPGMVEVADGGVAVAGELYLVPAEVLARVEEGEPPHLYRGPVRLARRGVVPGILYPADQVLDRHRDISKYGGWRAYVGQVTTSEPKGLEDD
jgi:gamma-glutamylcyclotransferase (GGCT)/AIG2-like uncharacterized protein YtfP